MKLFTNILFLALVISFGFSKGNYPDIWDNLMNLTQWEQVKVTEKYQLSKYDLDGFPIPAFKIKMFLKAHLQSILDVAWQIINIPLLAPRLYQYQHIRKRHRIDWYNVTVEQIINEDLIKAPINIGCWMISKKGEKDLFTYIFLTDPGGLIPFKFTVIPTFPKH